MTRNPAAGDKFGSPHGQKGATNVLWPQENMPFTEAGITPDFRFKLHGFPSIMTFDMLIESTDVKAAADEGLSRCFASRRLSVVFADRDHTESLTKVFTSRSSRQKCLARWTLSSGALCCFITTSRFHRRLFKVLFISLRNEAFPPVCGTAHPSGLRDRGADDGVHAQHDPRISAIMQSSLPVSLHGLVTAWLGVQVFLQGKLRCHSWTIICPLRGLCGLGWLVFRP